MLIQCVKLDLRKTIKFSPKYRIFSMRNIKIRKLCSIFVVLCCTIVPSVRRKFALKNIQPRIDLANWSRELKNKMQISMFLFRFMFVLFDMHNPNSMEAWKKKCVGNGNVTLGGCLFLNWKLRESLRQIVWCVDYELWHLNDGRGTHDNGTISL